MPVLQRQGKAGCKCNLEVLTQQGSLITGPFWRRASPCPLLTLRAVTGFLTFVDPHSITAAEDLRSMLLDGAERLSALPESEFIREADTYATRLQEEVSEAHSRDSRRLWMALETNSNGRPVCFFWHFRENINFTTTARWRTSRPFQGVRNLLIL